jgi:CRISPR-associated protein Csm1
MDVDNLGLVFIQGLNFVKREKNQKGEEGWGGVTNERKKMASISRIATLSRQLNCFFSGYINVLLKKEEFNLCQIIYTGGDDLFIIGAWNQLIELAKEIQREFSEFCSHNPDFSISGGLTLIHGKYPIYKGAKLAGEAEEKAKNLRKNWQRFLKQKKYTCLDFEKAGFCFLDTPILWDDFEIAEIIKDMLSEEIEKNKGLLSYLIKMQAENEIKVNMLKNKEKGLADSWLNIEYDSWRWRLVYQLKRRFGNNEEKKQKWSEILLANSIDKNKKAMLPVYSWLAFPLNWAKLLHKS